MAQNIRVEFMADVNESDSDDDDDGDEPPQTTRKITFKRGTKLPLISPIKPRRLTAPQQAVVRHRHEERNSAALALSKNMVWKKQQPRPVLQHASTALRIHKTMLMHAKANRLEASTRPTPSVALQRTALRRSGKGGGHRAVRGGVQKWSLTALPP